MNLPLSVRVGPHDIPISYKPCLDSDEEDCEVFGLFHSDGYRIDIKQGMRYSRTAEVLIHEVLHAIWANTRFTSDKNEERAVSVLAVALTQLAKDNPDFIKSWLEHATS